MKAICTCAALAIGLAGAGAAAQGGGEAMEKLRACSVLAPAQRLECLEKLSQDLAPAPPAATVPAEKMAPAVEDWTVSETTSPHDYTPVAVATAAAGGGPDAMQLSIQCRGGRTELVIGSAALTRRSDDYAVWYAVNDGAPAALPAAPPASGNGIAIKGDVVRLLASLPDRGEVAFRVDARQGGTVARGRYSLSALKDVRNRLAAPCNWPAANLAPK